MKAGAICVLVLLPRQDSPGLLFKAKTMDEVLTSVSKRIRMEGALGHFHIPCAGGASLKIRAMIANYAISIKHSEIAT